MNEYTIRWSMNVIADNAQEAVKKARAMQIIGNPYDMGYFRVYGPHHQIENGDFQEVDLADLWEEGNYREDNTALMKEKVELEKEIEELKKRKQ